MVMTLIAYVAGTQDMLDVCLASLQRHPAGVPNKIRIITKADPMPAQVFNMGNLIANSSYHTGEAYNEAMTIASKYEGVEVFTYEIGSTSTGSEMHGKLLDRAIYDVDTEFLLTLDSDCFPVADGWLATLVGGIRDGSDVEGILWPWAPPPDDLDKKTIEYRVRKNHCWNNTQVVCQLVRKSFILENGLLFNSGDDTGFAISEFARSKGLGVGGWKPTRCAMPEGDLDPEMNRYVCVVYGDVIYHQGGSTRKMQGAFIDPHGYYNEARERVFREKGAEWILKEGHVFKLDREEEVAQFKMRAMFDEMRRYLETHEALFDR